MDKAMLENLQRAVSLNPRFAEGHFAIGNIFREGNNLEAALSSYKKAIAVKPNYEAAYLNAGQILSSQGCLDEAIKLYQDATVRLPNSSAIHFYLALPLLQKKNFPVALSHFEAAIKLDLRCVEALFSIAQTLMDNGWINEAIRLLMLLPKSARSLMLLGDAFNRLGKIVEATNCWNEVIELDPNFVIPRQFVLRHSHYFARNSREKIFAGHAAFGDRIEASLRDKWSIPKRAWNSKKRLRVGFVSYDLVEYHPVGCFLESVLRELRRAGEIDIVVYSANPAEDAVTHRIRAEVQSWVSISALSDDALEKRIRNDRIDILVDLSGHTNGNRLTVFARKPAPVQVTWLGYWNTTGLRAIDYILCDPFCVHENEEGLFVEKPWYLPNTRLCFTPPAFDLPVAPLPALGDGYITFGCFNNRNKITDEVIALWARVLKAVKSSRLLLKWKCFFDASVCEDIVARFVKEGITADRLEFQEGSPLDEYFLAYNRVDIALDPFPFTGGATSAQGIWMGVPMITLKGDSMISRQGESMLHNLNLQDWIADDEDNYVELAVIKAADLAGLSKLRGELRLKLELSPLSDAGLFAQNLNGAFKQMWERFCRSN